jgi:FAD/FMN-containing dehydrogenase
MALFPYVTNSCCLVARGNFGSEAFEPFTSGGEYVNDLGREAEEGMARIKAGYGANYERLVALKAKYDPTNLFRHNQNIPPTV